MFFFMVRGFPHSENNNLMDFKVFPEKEMIAIFDASKHLRRNAVHRIFFYLMTS